MCPFPKVTVSGAILFANNHPFNVNSVVVKMSRAAVSPATKNQSNWSRPVQRHPAASEAASARSDGLIYGSSDFIKSLIPRLAYSVSDERHQSRWEDLTAALICLFNGVVERKVVTAGCGTKR